MTDDRGPERYQAFLAELAVVTAAILEGTGTVEPSAEAPGLAGVVGFYGRLGKRENDPWPVPAEQVRRGNALAVTPEETTALAAGDSIDVLLLDDFDAR